jgi:hypothetical protein
MLSDEVTSALQIDAAQASKKDQQFETHACLLLKQSLQ